MANIKGPVRDVFQYSGLVRAIGTENILWEVKDAVKVNYTVVDVVLYRNPFPKNRELQNL